MVSNVSASVCLVLLACVDARSLSVGLIISMYLSQYSCQMNW